ncbi:hypothetical protein TI39_contig4540g00001 [Zymoseptoria brevis]|uniref:Uncharacterized protein n=1 Tax=Zymoseptoria brevis TaxID=1047168 RepID=A0A0F4G6F5_9PEZI|nr:hypothetical protein TI39_contig4540g00001 [Zymoseptoria brevis]
MRFIAATTIALLSSTAIGMPVAKHSGEVLNNPNPVYPRPGIERSNLQERKKRGEIWQNPNPVYPGPGVERAKLEEHGKSPTADETIAKRQNQKSSVATNDA